MDIVSSFYPPLASRNALPIFYIPTLWVLLLIPFVLPQTCKSYAIIFSLFFALFICLPGYTAGSTGDDYRAGIAASMFLGFYLETVIWPPADGLKTEGQGLKDCKTFWEKLVWAVQLQSTNRGVGWNWQVKGVPSSDDENLPKWAFIRRRIFLAVRSTVINAAVLYLLGICLEAKEMGIAAETATASWGYHVAIGWLTVCWSVQYGSGVYNAFAAAFVSMGMSKQSDWPPLFGRLSDAWSLRQTWGVFWHQQFRRALQQPSIRVSRFLGFKSGTFGSKYFQLFASFVFSTLLHEWCMFNATRRDGGEFVFFMSQPVAIVCEDFVQWCWKNFAKRSSEDELTLFERRVGWTWSFLWFSYSFGFFANSVVSADILTQNMPFAVDLGRQHAAEMFK